MFTFKVKIVKNTKPDSWYKDLVGTVRNAKFALNRANSVLKKILGGVHLEDADESTKGCGYILMVRDCRLVLRREKK